MPRKARRRLSNLDKTDIRLHVPRNTLLGVKIISDSPGKPLSPSQRFIKAIWNIWVDQPTRWGLIILLVLAGIPTVTHGILSIPIIGPEQSGNSGLGYRVEQPLRYVTLEDERFTITLINRTPISLTQVSATLVFSDNIPIGAETTTADFEDLASGEQKTRHIGFNLRQPIGQDLARPITVTLQATTHPTGTTVLSKTYSLKIVHFPGLKTTGRYFGGLLFSGLSGGLLWLIRKAFEDIVPK